MHRTVGVVGVLIAAALGACQGAAHVPSGLRLCQDFGAEPYRVKFADGGVLTRHGGLDFCGAAGTPVFAVTDGQVSRIVANSPLDGGSVTIRTSLVTPFSGNAIPATRAPIHARLLHIVPRAGLGEGDQVEAGEIVGRIQDPARITNANWSHVHLELTTCPDENYRCVLNPHDYWRFGESRVSCFEPETDMPNGRIVAPLRCVSR